MSEWDCKHGNSHDLCPACWNEEKNELKAENAELKAALLEGWEREGEGKCPLCNIIQDAEDRKRIALEAELRARIKAFDNYVDRARKFRAIAQRAADSLNEGLGT